jgi:flagellin-like hook-associated protein FlgL
MSVSSIGSTSGLALQQMLEMRSQFSDLQRQLSSGLKSDNYAGLGTDGGMTVSLRAQLSQIGSYDDTIDTVGTRIDLMTQVLQQMGNVGNDVKTAAEQNINTNSTPVSVQQTSQSSLDELLGLLNSQAGDRYLFSGSATDQPAVESMDHILNGDGTRAGLKQVIDERRQADLGADGLGRLAVTSTGPGSVSVAEEAVPFGLKLASASGSLTNGTVTGPSGSPAALSINFTGVPNAGDTVTLRFNLPDGSSENLTLTATTDSPPGANQFTIGANATATATNFQTALTSAIGKLAGGPLAAASAIAASQQFFDADANNPPQRVDGPPFDTATGFVAGSAANTVIWYTGEAGSGSARSTSTARVDPTLTISYGARANETAIRNLVQNTATLAAVTISSGDPNGAAESSALNTRLVARLTPDSSDQTTQSIATELATAANAMNSAKDRHQQTSSTLNSFLDQVQNAQPEDVGAQLLALQTRMQATMQTTAMLSQLSLVNYMQ